MWAVELEEAEENRYTCGIRGYFKMQTIERDFALSIELHGFCYTQEYGQARIEALTYAYINLKSSQKSGGKRARNSMHLSISNYLCHIPADSAEKTSLL